MGNTTFIINHITIDSTLTYRQYGEKGNTMKLYEYLKLMPDGEELTVWDKDYDIETYFYAGKPHDKWDKEMTDLAKLLTITEIGNSGVTVNLSDIIYDKIGNLDRFFITDDIDLIMCSMETILAGGVSPHWMEQFVAVLSAPGERR